MAKIVKEFETRSGKGRKKGFMQFIVNGNDFIIRSGEGKDNIHRTDKFNKKDIEEMVSGLLESYSKMNRKRRKDEKNVTDMISELVEEKGSEKLKKKILYRFILPEGKKDIDSIETLGEAYDNLEDLKKELIGILEEKGKGKIVNKKKKKKRIL